MPHFLDEIFLDGIRGINDLRVGFNYPVSVIAGENGSGKSTVLFAAACAYEVKGSRPKAVRMPATLFPTFRPQAGGRSDNDQMVTLKFEYTTPEGKLSMRYTRPSRRWTTSFYGRRNVRQPERELYLRMRPPSNLSDPSEVKGVLRMTRMASEPQESPLSASQIQFARSVLPSFRYSEVVDLSGSTQRLLFATQEDGSQYSELHMAAGERAILRLSQEIAQLQDALVLIDEVETGLHPLAQKLLMLQLQQLALNNNLQIIVTSHSQVILNSVPVSGRIFLRRSADGVTIQEPWPDIVQNVLYGQSDESLNILCEDKVAKGVIEGIIDAIRPELDMSGGVTRVTPSGGAAKFLQYAEVFKKTGQIQNLVFVLDGDQENTQEKYKLKLDELHDKEGIPLLFLPGQHAPEVWVWDQIRERPGAIAPEVGTRHESLQNLVVQLDAAYAAASDTPSNIAKAKLDELAQEFNQTPPQLSRVVAKVEVQRPDSDIRRFDNGLRDAIREWRLQQE